MKRRELRELALNLIFQSLFQNEVDLDLNKYYKENNIRLTDNDKSFIEPILEYFYDNQNAIKEKLESSLNEEWKLDRLNKVDQAILLLCLSEICIENQIDYKISINEALELSKKYSDDNSPSFINGVLSTFLKNEGIE